MDPKNEEVAIVDIDNQLIGSAPRHEMRSKGLVHRATYILVFNMQGEIFVQERTMNKDIYPGFFDVATGGVVLAGESYEESAQRELAEELGVRGAELTSHFYFFHRDEHNQVWGRVFSCTHNGPITLQEEEVADGFFMSVDNVLALARSKDFTPDGLLVLKRFLNRSEEVTLPVS
ncbi:MAG: NUDIX hydrolase YfcD [Desulfobulbaceae bacterium]|nr:NUDIX hydrolase YfcD [Desulfobulbaceae bacterium]